MARTARRIGAAKSTNRGLTWEDPGIVLEAPADSLECSTVNLNRAEDASWRQEGIDVLFASPEQFPAKWSEPRKLRGRRARFFTGGRSDYEITFERLP